MNASAALRILVALVVLIATAANVCGQASTHIRLTQLEPGSCVQGHCDVVRTTFTCTATNLGRLPDDRLLLITVGHLFYRADKNPDLELWINGRWEPGRLEALGSELHGPDLAAVSVAAQGHTWPFAKLDLTQPVPGEPVALDSVVFGSASGRILGPDSFGRSLARYDRPLRAGDSGGGVYSQRGLLLGIQTNVFDNPDRRQVYDGRFIHGAVIDNWLRANILFPHTDLPEPPLRDAPSFDTAIPHIARPPEPVRQPEPPRPPEPLPPIDRAESIPLQTADPDRNDIQAESPPPATPAPVPSAPSSRRTLATIGWKIVKAAVPSVATVTGVGGSVGVGIALATLFVRWRRSRRASSQTTLPSSVPTEKLAESSSTCSRCSQLRSEKLQLVNQIDDLNKERQRLTDEIDRLQSTRTAPQVTAATQFVPYETSRFREAYQYAVTHAAKRYPGAESMFEYLESQMKQFLSSKGAS